MIKKLTTFLAFSVLSFVSYGQTIVSTSPENKKVILEEFTGIYCVYCPQGHAIAQAIQDANPNEVYLINVHVGGYAAPTGSDPDFRTPYGTAIVNQTGLVGYPAGSVNRLNFPGLEQGAAGTTAMSRGQWTQAANQVLAESSYVNVGVEANIDITTNELTVHVEGYYTGNSPEGTNLLNVALLQNNTEGPQTGGNAGNNYVHMHRLVEMVTGQWGIEIPTTTTGTFVDETYTYPIPADYNGIPVDIVDLEVVAFITETHQTIASGSGAYPTYSGITTANDASLTAIEEINFNCFDVVEPTITIQNLGADTLTSIDIEYSVNSGPTEIYTWTGNLPSLHSETFQLDGISYISEATDTVYISMPNDDDNTNNSGQEEFESIGGSAGAVTLVINTDDFGSECTWTLKTASGSPISGGGPYDNNETIQRTFNLGENCYYVFTLLDSSGNGGTTATFTDETGITFFETDGSFGAQIIGNFGNSGALGVSDNALQNVAIYPNPASTILNIQNAENASINIYNMLGQELYSKTNISLNEQVQVSNYNTGTYFVKITDGNEVKTSKFIVSK
ncbi:T9SS type A sorting domain-containing protein [Ulvibacter litoralis]|uniref:Por secretion system C-terminal sorting domain-containing protein n=1 Tax=Ulvibacter litoralis TaxID=227084 RepID=A0A1G7GGQ9_9FLAO|nr:T9SS type A sorting domain-containing protein [Ulvibacter litoralis]GHC56274.1 hypothetical protein GCM10008083_20950 [Ulvibacter litoralis]SDE87307.1 Por secretion system C-terminal sorting domain-containing protein [Ulvibacter litoralis]